MDPGKKDDIGIGTKGLLGKSQTVPDMVGHFLDLWFLVIMRQDQGIFLFFELKYFSMKVHGSKVWSWELQKGLGTPSFPKPSMVLPTTHKHGSLSKLRDCPWAYHDIGQGSPISTQRFRTGWGKVPDGPKSLGPAVPNASRPRRVP